MKIWSDITGKLTDEETVQHYIYAQATDEDMFDITGMFNDDDMVDITGKLTDEEMVTQDMVQHYR